MLSYVLHTIISGSVLWKLQHITTQEKSLLISENFPCVVGGCPSAAGVVVEVLVGGVAAAVPQQVRLVTAVASATAVSPSGGGSVTVRLRRDWRASEIAGIKISATCPFMLKLTMMLCLCG